MNPDLSFFLSHVRVDVICPIKEVLAGLKAVWKGAHMPHIKTSRSVVLELEANQPHRIFCDGEAIDETEECSPLLPGFEAVIYKLLHQWHQQYTIIHAALLQRDGCTLVLAGASGSGKSSLALQALHEGWTYRTDELVITDGRRLWGITRAIQFDPMPGSARLPEFLANADVTSYRWIHPEAGMLCQPLVAVPGEFDQITPCLDRARLFILQPDSETGTTRLNGVEALAHLHQACFGQPRHDLGGLASQAWKLGWNDTETALCQINELCQPGLVA